MMAADRYREVSLLMAVDEYLRYQAAHEIFRRAAHASGQEVVVTSSFEEFCQYLLARGLEAVGREIAAGIETNGGAP